MFWGLPNIAVFSMALGVTWLITPRAAWIARKLGAIDHPGNRRINTSPIPRMGGIAVLCGLIAAATLQWFGTKLFDWPMVLNPAMEHADIDYHLLAFSTLVMFLVGAIDDVINLKPLIKFLGQILAAVIAVIAGLVIGRIVNPFGGTIDLGFLAYPITVIYLVSYANIINLIDGLDGLASGITGISSLTMLGLSLLAGRPDAAALSAGLAGASFGFLRHNFHPASIFLGDCGALLMGFCLGVISILNVTRIAGLTTMIIPLIIAAVPILDTFSAIIRRKRAHVSIGQADRGHLHHRLMDSGFDQKQAVLLIYLWCLLLCIGAVAMTQVSVWIRAFIFIMLAAASFMFARNLRLFEPVLLRHWDEEKQCYVLIGSDDEDFEHERMKLKGRRHKKA